MRAQEQSAASDNSTIIPRGTEWDGVGRGASDGRLAGSASRGASSATSARRRASLIRAPRRLRVTGERRRHGRAGAATPPDDSPSIRREALGQCPGPPRALQPKQRDEHGDRVARGCGWLLGLKEKKKLKLHANRGLLFARGPACDALHCEQRRARDHAGER